MYQIIREELRSLFGREKVALCLDCLSVTAFDYTNGAMCPSCDAGDDENILVFDSVDMMLDCLEAQETDIHSFEVCEGDYYPVVVLNMCFVDLLDDEPIGTTQSISYSLGLAW